LALALGVGQSHSSSVRFPPLDRVPEHARGVGQVVALAVGKDEEPLAAVRRSHFQTNSILKLGLRMLDLEGVMSQRAIHEGLRTIV
jgi:hypothetical protein